MEIPGIKLLEKIGTGGMSTVWKAWDENLARHVAIKILNPELSRLGSEVRAMKLEEKRMEEIHHQGIVEAYGFDCADGQWFIKMEYVDGYTFSDFIHRRHRVPEADCLLIAQSVAAALDYAWNDHGIVHCDIKPENLMVNSDGVIKILDLGISYRFQFRDDDDHTAAEQITGTPAYISPEQVYADVELDCRTDIYSLGATLYHLATGQVLFPGYEGEAAMRAHCGEDVQAKDPRLYRPDLSRGFAQMLEAMLVKDRDGRLSGWNEVFAVAQAVERGSEIPRRETPGNSSLLLSPYG